MYWGDFKPYVSVAEKKAKALKKLAQLRKKHPNIQPVTITGHSLATTWWGKAWNKNLESYADYENRIGRGRSYVRHNAVLDLKITTGRIKALVQGSSSKPYEVNIQIEPLSKEKWHSIRTRCQGELNSLQALLDGKFPKTLGEIFTAHKTGLFPSPVEISFNCSCPDWASMCKHVAATLYGVGTRLDSEPGLFFTLRDVNITELVSQAVEEKKSSLLEKARKKSTRVIADSDLSQLFGIEMEDAEAFIATHTKSPSNKGKAKAKSKTKTPGKTKKRQAASPQKAQITDLKDTQQRVLRLLRKRKAYAGTDPILAKKAQISPSYLRLILEELVAKGFLKKEKKGKKVQYWIVSK